MVLTRRRAQDRAVRSSAPSPEPVQTGLPGLDTLPVHRYNSGAENGNKMVSIIYDLPRVTPRNCDYVVDPEDWADHNRGSMVDDTGAPLGSKTVAEILGADIDGYQCEICDEVGAACNGEPCISQFRKELARTEDRYLEIRKAGSIGFGVFAKRAIPKGTILSEYTGRLTPLDAHEYGNSDYVFHMNATARCDAAVYGNIARFVNHHCTEYNVDVVDVMYGRRKVLCYQANRDIPEAEQLFVTYGCVYWTGSRPCLCSASEYPHVIDEYNRIRRAPATALDTNQKIKKKTKQTKTKVEKAKRKAKKAKSRRARWT